MKPNRNVSFLPFQIYNNQTIVCDRSVYKFDFIFESETQQVNSGLFRIRFMRLWARR